MKGCQFRGSKWHAAFAALHGKRARAMVFEYLDISYGTNLDPTLDEIIVQVRKAAHHANLAFGMVERAARPLLQKLANQEANLQRQASTPRCSYRRVSDEKQKDGSTLQVAGDPCDGKLKAKLRHRVVIGGECATCGRFYPVPQAEPAKVETALEGEAALA